MNLSKRWTLVAVAGLCAVTALAVACGGGGDDDKDGTKTPSTTKTVTKTGTVTSKTGTPGADETADAGTTPGAAASPGAAGTPAPGATLAPGATAPAGGATPGAVATVDPSNPFIQPAPTPSDAERGLTDGVDPDLLGGDPGDAPEVVTDLPPVPQGATIDPATIAAPNANVSDVQLIIDTNASEPGIQTSRTVRVGDVFRVGVVLTNAEPLGAFNFFLNYDYTKAIAPTINGGSSLARNPDLNEAGLGGEAAAWSCTPPAPEGDADEPGIGLGDGDPATGQAVVSCFNPGIAPPSGTLVLVTVQFQAIATGTFELSTANSQEPAAIFDGTFAPVAACEGDFAVPCPNASITVESR